MTKRNPVGVAIAIVGAPRDNPGRAGSAHIFSVRGRTWKRQARIVAVDAAKGDLFGTAVGIQRHVAVVGAHLADRVRGSAYIFERSGTQWRQKQKLVPADLERSNEFGRELVIHEDVIVVGAPNHTHSGVRFAGAAYVFVRDGDTKGSPDGSGQVVSIHVICILIEFTNGIKVEQKCHGV